MSIEVHENPTFNERDWTAQRVGWVVFALIIVAALAGLFGPGPISHSEARSPDGLLAVDYLRYTRNGGTGTLTVVAQPELLTDGVLEIRVDDDWLDRMTVEHITPTPTEQRFEGGDVVSTFLVAVSDQPVSVTFMLTPDASGSAAATVAAGSSVARFTQFVYP